MARGGKRPGAGRKPSAVTQRARDVANRLAEGDELTPLDYLLSIMRDDKLDRRERVDAAKAAAPFVHPRLNAVDHQSSDGSMADRPTVIKLVAPKFDDGD